MGCTQSKIENEETVYRCKERKRFMKEAVLARNAFAAAHSAYGVALKSTGAALSDYAHGEFQHPQYYPRQSNAAVAAAVQLPIESLPPPPPLPNFQATTPLQRAATMPEIKPKAEARPVGPTIEEEEEEEENKLENDEGSSLRQRSSRGARDRRSGGGSRSGSRKEAMVETEAPPQRAVSPQRPPPQEFYEYFFPPAENVPAPTLGEVAAEEVRIDKKQVESKVFSERHKSVEDIGEVAGPVVSEKAVETPAPAAAEVSLPVKSAKRGKVGMTPDGKRVPKDTITLAQILLDLDDYFLKASESAHEVSKMLEATRLHYHSNFADNRGEKSLLLC